MELRKIVVGIDFSPASEAAAREAIELARHTGAEIVLVHAGAVLEGPPVSPVPGWERVLRERLAEERRQLDELRARLAGPDVAVSTTVVDGFPDTGMVDAARDLDAELIVTGSHGRTGLRRLLLGSVAERVVRLADGCVLVSRPGGNYTGGYHRMLVPTDFSPHAEEALRMALVLAASDATIELVHFWQLPPLTTGYEASMLGPVAALGPLREAIIADAEKHGRTLVDRYRRAGVNLVFDLAEDGAAHGIADRARAAGRSYDAIITGSHGRRGFRRLLLGSVAEATVRHAPCSVMVVHLKDRKE